MKNSIKIFFIKKLKIYFLQHLDFFLVPIYNKGKYLESGEIMPFLYKQVYDDLLYKIKTGVYPGGTLLPSLEELSSAYSVSPITVKHALTDLKKRNVIRRIKHKGSIVLEQPDVPLPGEVASLQENPPIAVVFPYYDDNKTRIINGLKSYVFGKNIRLNFFDSMHSLDTEREILRRLSEERLGGLILLPLHPAYNIDLVSKISIRGIPIAFMDFALNGIRKPCVRSDNFTGMYDMVTYLINCRHTRIGFISARQMISTEQERFGGYCHALIKNGIPVTQDYIFTFPSDAENIGRGNEILDTYNEQCAHDAIRYFASLPARPSAIVCMNDYVASYVMRAAREQGYGVPEDFSVTGFDNLTVSQELKLTTVTQNFEKIAQEALNSIFLQQSKKAPPPSIHRSAPSSSGAILSKITTFNKGAAFRLRNAAPLLGAALFPLHEYAHQAVCQKTRARRKRSPGSDGTALLINRLTRDSVIHLRCLQLCKRFGHIAPRQHRIAEAEHPRMRAVRTPDFCKRSSRERVSVVHGIQPVDRPPIGFRIGRLMPVQGH